MTARLRTWRQKYKQLLIIVGIAIILLLIVFALAVHWLGWDWTGFTGYDKVTTARIISVTSSCTVTRTEEYQPGKTLWDWLGLIAALAIPVVVGFGAAWFTAQQGKVSARENTDNQRAATLQAYIDKMSELLIKEHLGCELSSTKGELTTTEEEVRKIARVRTLTALEQLDGKRKRIVLQFLHESGMIGKDKTIIALRGANLVGADLRGAILNGADLHKVNLSGAHLNRADLSFVAKLSGADFTGADLRGANFAEADLTGAKVTTEQLDKAKSLEGATMPDGSKHPWGI